VAPVAAMVSGTDPKLGEYLSASQVDEWTLTQHASGAPYGTMHPSQCKEQFSIAYVHAIVTAARCKIAHMTVDDERVDLTIRQKADHKEFSSLSDNPTTTLDDAVGRGVSAELLESLRDMSASDGVKALDMSFRWSPSESAPPNRVPERVIVQREQAQRADKVSQGLKKKQVSRDDSVVGYVRRLERAEGDEDGIVVIDGSLAHEPGRRNLRMSLSGDAYLKAVRAHEHRAPVVATGTVVYERRAWYLRGNVTLDEALGGAKTPPTV